MSRFKARLYLSSAVVLEAALLLSGCATSVPRIEPVATESAPDPKTVAEPHPASNNGVGKTAQILPRADWRRFPEPQQSEIAEVMPMFGTYYRTAKYAYVPDGIPILDLSGKPLGPKLSVNDFCRAADAGAFRAPRSGGSGLGSYTIAGAPSVATSQANCSPVFKTNIELFEQGKTAENWPSIVAA